MNVCITGMGCVSPAAPDCAGTWDGLQGDDPPALTGVSETGQIVFRAVADPAYDSGGARHRSLDLLLQALDEARSDAGLDTLPDPARIGVCLGATSASFLNDMLFHRRLRDHELDPEPIRRFFSGNPAEFVKARLGLGGPAMTVTNACASGTDAVGIAAAWLAGGVCDLVIAGGADELHTVSAAGFYSLGVTSQHLCRPFDRDRDGLNLGEGAAVLILETPASARRRGRRTGLTVAGYAAAGDARHITQPDPEGTGIERAVRNALHQAGLRPDDIGFINAHGTGTIHNDLAEGLAFARIFQGRCPYHSTKGKTGHTLGAAGAIEAVIAALMLRRGRIAASCRCPRPDPDLPFAPATREMPVSSPWALSTSLAFGGCNSALILHCQPEEQD